ncbi:MAG: sigma-70 family RNA polymerase sigma factor [Acidobacteria bacterium]|nr:sigma-70 family RNA polymerase sigma factor [Acidobacteriota bacterium]
MSEDNPSPAAKAPVGEVTQLLRMAQQGDPQAPEQLYPLIYAELRRIARRLLAGERAGHTLDTAGLVNEAYLKLADPTQNPAEGRAHFLRIAARAMRQILVDHARRKGAEKRGGDWARTSMDEARLGQAPRGEEMLALDEALNRLNEVDERLRQIVEFRFFAGLSETEIAEALGVTTRTVQREWAKARAWLHKELYGGRE